MSTQSEIDRGLRPAESDGAPVPGDARRPWGLVATLLITALIFALYSLLSGAVIAGVVVAEKLADNSAELDVLVNDAMQNGMVICLSVVIAGACGLAATLYFSGKRAGYSYREYLALQPVSLVPVAFGPRSPFFSSFCFRSPPTLSTFRTPAASTPTSFAAPTASRFL